MEYLCKCLCILYLVLGIDLCCGICKEEYLEKLQREKKIKKEYDKLQFVNVDIEMNFESNSKLSTIEEEDEEI
jgi:hypothetical protein